MKSHLLFLNWKSIFPCLALPILPSPSFILISSISDCLGRRLGPKLLGRADDSGVILLVPFVFSLINLEVFTYRYDCAFQLYIIFFLIISCECVSVTLLSRGLLRSLLRSSIKSILKKSQPGWSFQNHFVNLFLKWKITSIAQKNSL